MNKKKLVVSIMILAILGMVLTSTLLGAKYLHKMAELCGLGPEFGESESCLVVQESPYSYLINGEYFGIWIAIPLSLAGFMYYFFMLALSLDLHRLYRKNQKISKKRINIYFGFAVLGALFSVAFLYIQGVLIGAFCKYCVMSALLTFLILILAIFVKKN